MKRHIRSLSRRQCRTSCCALVALLVSLAPQLGGGFSFSTATAVMHVLKLKTKRPATSASSTTRRLLATREDEKTAAVDGGKIPTSWSNSGERRSSRFGVRKRVRAVLEKAKSRTGVRNVNSDGHEAGCVVADAASIGGLSEGSGDLIFEKTIPTVAPYSTAGRTPPPSSTGSVTMRNDTDSLVLESSTETSTTTTVSAIETDDSLPNKRNTVNGSSRMGTGGTPNGSSPNNGSSLRHDPPVEVDAVLNAEQSLDKLEPLPFDLPVLSDEQRELLLKGERIQEQSKMGREGSGFVVMDVKAPPYVVWECLLDFESYVENIGTVRSMTMFTNTHLKSSYNAEMPVLPGTGRETRHYGTASVTRAAFVLSKFRLKIAAIHRYKPHPDGHYMVFTLDKGCTNMVLQHAKGTWYTQGNPDGRGEDYTRVWLLCELRVSRLLPKLIVDYAAKRAMPRATTWLRPCVEKLRDSFGLLASDNDNDNDENSSSSSGPNGTTTAK